MSRRLYRIYPSILNDFYYYMIEKGAEDGKEPWVSEVELINRINRVRSAPSEAMVKGIGFENLIFDESIELPEFISEEVDDSTEIVMTQEHEGVKIEENVTVSVIRAARSLYLGGEQQVLVSSMMEFPDYDVELYGKIDVIKRATGVDIKFTSRPEYLKFKDSFQHPVYMRGMMAMFKINGFFDYFVSDLKDWTMETYAYSDQMEERLREWVRRFVEFLELRKEHITVTKIFGAKV